MKARYGIIVMTIGLAACTSTSSNYGRPKVITPQTFACSDGQHAKVKVYSPAEAVMGFRGKQYEMKRVETASGAKYAGSGAEFWSKGISAMITTDGKLVTCNAVPADATGEEDLTLPGDAMAPYPAPVVDEAAFDEGEVTEDVAPTPAAKPASGMEPYTGYAVPAPAAKPAVMTAPVAPTPSAKPKTITTAN